MPASPAAGSSPSIYQLCDGGGGGGGEAAWEAPSLTSPPTSLQSACTHGQTTVKELSRRRKRPKTSGDFLEPNARGGFKGGRTTAVYPEELRSSRAGYGALRRCAVGAPVLRINERPRKPATRRKKCVSGCRSYSTDRVEPRQRYFLIFNALCVYF